MMSSEWNIYLTALRELKVNAVEPLEGGLKLEYEGVMREVGPLFYFELEGGKHRERWHFVGKPDISNSEFCGVYSGISRDQRPYAGLMLLTRIEIDKAKAKERLGSKDNSISFPE